MKNKKFLLLTLVVFLMLALVSAVSAEEKKEESNIEKWLSAFNHVSGITDPDEVWKYLSSKKSGYTCYKLENDFGRKQFECMRSMEKDRETYTLTVFVDENDVVRKTVSVFVYALDEETASDKQELIAELIRETYADDEEYSDDELISSFILGEDWHQAYKINDRAVIATGSMDTKLNITHIILTSIIAGELG